MTRTAKRPDRRVARTRALLRDALMRLIVEKGYDTISVQDITDAADVARTTFYLHYHDKEDLLLSSMEEIYDELAERMGAVTPHGLLADGTPAEIVAFQHVAEHAEFYRVMFSKHGVAAFINRVRSYLADVVLEFIQQMPPGTYQPRLPLEVVAYREAGALVGLISWWLENNMPYSPEEMSQMFYEAGSKGNNWACGWS